MNIIKSIWLLILKYTNTVKRARLLGVEVGYDTMISSSVIFSSEPYLIKIGKHCQITSGVLFNTHGGGHVIRSLQANFDMFGKISIEDNVYVGSRSIIMPGVTIGESALVAAGSVVTKSVPPFTVVAGNPARVICSIDEFIRKNLKYNAGTFNMSYEDKKYVLSHLSEDQFVRK